VCNNVITQYNLPPTYEPHLPLLPQPQSITALVLIVPTHKGMARLSWPGWLVTYRDKCQLNRTRTRSPIPVLTRPDGGYLRWSRPTWYCYARSPGLRIAQCACSLPSICWYLRTYPRRNGRVKLTWVSG